MLSRPSWRGEAQARPWEPVGYAKSLGPGLQGQQTHVPCPRNTGGRREWKSLQSNAERALDLHLRFASEGCLNTRGSGLILTSTSAALTLQVYSLATVKVEKGSHTRGSPSFWCLGLVSFFLQQPCLQKLMQPSPSLQGRALLCQPGPGSPCPRSSWAP